MDALTQIDALGPVLAGVMSGISEDQLDNKTPCTEYTVRGVLEHMISGATAFASTFRGEEPAEAPLADVLAEIDPALTELFASMHLPGALDGTVQAPFGEVPRETFARFVVLDGLVHGWDLSVSTGQTYDPPTALVDAVAAFAAEAVPPLRNGVTFGPEIECGADATPIERLAALTGREK